MTSPVMVTMDRQNFEAIRYPSQTVPLPPPHMNLDAWHILHAPPTILPPPTAQATAALLPPPTPGFGGWPLFGVSYQEAQQARARSRVAARERVREGQRERARRIRLDAAPRGEGRLLTPPRELTAPATQAGAGAGTQTSNVASLVPVLEDAELSNDASSSSDSDSDSDESDYVSSPERDNSPVSFSYQLSQPQPSSSASSDEEDSIVEITSEEFHGSFTVVIPAPRTSSQRAAANHPYTHFVDESSAEELSSEEDEDTTPEYESPAEASVSDAEPSQEIDIHDDEFMAHLTAINAELRADIALPGAAIAAYTARKEVEAS